jgi:hypothetical protein
MMLEPTSNREKEKRSGLDRREYEYNSHIPERRAPAERRTPPPPVKEDQQDADPSSRLYHRPN